MSYLSGWVNDSLHSLLGFSDGTVSRFVVSLGHSATSPAALLQSLRQEADLPDTAATRRFAEDLYRKAHGETAPTPSPAPAPTERLGEYLREAETGASSSNVSFTKSEADTKRATRRKKTTGVRDEVIEIEEDAHERDQRLKREFEERLKRKDEEKTKKFSGSKISYEEAEEIKRRKQIAALEDEEEKNKMVERLRDTSRRMYLKKREGQVIRDAEEAVRDESIFQSENITEAEKQNALLKRKELQIVKELRADRDREVDAYMIPEDEFDDRGKLDAKKKFEKMTSRFHRQEEERATVMNTEQAEWEDHQVAKTQHTFGSKKKSKRARRGDKSSGSILDDTELLEESEDEFDYLFDEQQIDFISEGLVAGTMEEGGETPADTNASKFSSLDEVRKSLPIYKFREQLLAAVAAHQVIIIVGETGSGKTTQIPQYLYEGGYCKGGLKVGCTQPRRVAAMSVAKRVADEMGVRLGYEVGYSIRFEDCTSDKTVVKYMTDGMLLREFLGEPDLKSYSTLIIDEAHERTLHTDILFGLVKDVARFRPDLKLLISSATLDAAKFSQYFDDAPIFKIPGRTYPVDVMYTRAPEADYIEAAIVTTLQIHITQPPGDILIFLTGQDEVETCADALVAKTRGLGNKIKELIVCKIYSTLPSDLQAKIFEETPPGARKVVVSTNISETSLTIDGICFVIDCGFSKQKDYDPRTGMESLVVTPVSKASANQRAGRAGRTQKGTCFRLFTKWAFHHELEENTIPEIQRTNLGNVVLMLKSLGINDLLHFDFMDAPPAETLIRALEQLYALGSLNDRGELTKLGRRMAEFPLEPQLSKMILASEAFHCSEEMLTIAAMLSVGGAIFYRPKDKQVHADHAMKNFFRPFGDHLTLLNVYNQWVETDYSTQWCFENFIQHRSMIRAHDVRDQLVGLLERVEISIETNEDVDDIRKCIASGFFYHTARMQKGGNYKTTKHQQSVMVLMPQHPLLNLRAFNDFPCIAPCFSCLIADSPFILFES
eukprot:TRINITY_DN710_c0_g1_i1.p1 TRINITY_DN710_c0_g1~~TRINITY_DN710_c0_g1_i1.p1  ORF type:complete len:1005 (+),score=215.59 TRINITY_DN710_c0_g1_i1:41-3055(+)